MIPLAHHVIIQPSPIVQKNIGGIIVVDSNPPFVHTAKVLQVSNAINNTDVKPGYTIAFLYGQMKWQEGHCIIEHQHIQAIL